MKVLILGGTTEASALAQRLAGDTLYDATLSFAGRTANIAAPSVSTRVGGFGGMEGLVRYLQDRAVAAVVDATHPFAAQMSAHAVAAARIACVPLLRLERPQWHPEASDRWIDVSDMAEAARVLGKAPCRVFLPIGKLEIGAFASTPQHFYLIRAIDAFEPPFPHCRVIAARGPFAVEAEQKLLASERIDIVVSKNSGAAATVAKIIAARNLELPVVMVARPVLSPAETVRDVSQALDWLHRLLPSRGE